MWSGSCVLSGPRQMHVSYTVSLSCCETFLVVWFSCHANHPAMQSDIWGDRWSGYLDNSIWERVLLYICEKSIRKISLTQYIGPYIVTNLCVANDAFSSFPVLFTLFRFAKCHIWHLYLIYQLSKARVNISPSLLLFLIVIQSKTANMNKSIVWFES